MQKSPHIEPFILKPVRNLDLSAIKLPGIHAWHMHSPLLLNKLHAIQGKQNHAKQHRLQLLQQSQRPCILYTKILISKDLNKRFLKLYHSCSYSQTLLLTGVFLTRLREPIFFLWKIFLDYAILNSKKYFFNLNSQKY